jgi:hypothetical protein
MVAARTSLAEEKAPGKAVLAQELVAELLHAFDGARRQLERPQARQDVDDRLGSEPRDRRAADVLDLCDRVAESSCNAAAFLLEQLRPARVVVDDDDRLVGIRPHAPPALCSAA